MGIGFDNTRPRLHAVIKKPTASADSCRSIEVL